jgi:hypothetical protein
MRQIFVSYAEDSLPFAARLADDLKASGANIWIDVRNARPGRHWTRSIEQALSDSAMMIVVLSPGALQSPHVSVEWQAYLEAYRPVIPVLASACDLPGPLRTRRPVDFTRERYYQRAFHHLMNRLIEYGTRTRRSDPVIWTMTETVYNFRDERAYREPPLDRGVSAPAQHHPRHTSDAARRHGVARNLRELLRRGVE